MTAECHDLAQDAQGTRFAFADHTAPWHRLGTAMPADLQDMESMLAAARANFEVRTTKVVACDEEGIPLMNWVDVDGVPTPQYVYVENSRATVACDVWGDGKFTGLATVGTRYVPTQNQEVMARALAIVNASADTACVDTVGVMDQGRQFFASIRLGDLDLVTPDGVVDKISRYLNVRTSHDGKTPITYMNGDIRMVCRNTVNMATKAAKQTFTARHTRNSVADFMSENMLGEARDALNISTKWSEALQASATALMGVEITSTKVDRFLAEMFPIDAAETDRKRDLRDAKVGAIRGLYVNDRNAGTFGPSGWSLYNATVEYFDHYRDGTPDERAKTSFDLGSWVNKAKVEAQGRILAMAN